jgi:nicotinamide-nucleotide amidase
VGRVLRSKKLTLSIAESCTGGYLSHLITSIPGSSDYFSGAMIAYSNEIKSKDLGVNVQTLEQHGAVSEATIKEMASLVRKKFNTDIGVATSGVAGPGGGTPDKPVGTVWIAYADSQHIIARKLQLSKDRLINIRIASIQVLNLIRTTLLNSK